MECGGEWQGLNIRYADRQIKQIKQIMQLQEAFPLQAPVPRRRAVPLLAGLIAIAVTVSVVLALFYAGTVLDGFYFFTTFEHGNI